MWVKLENQSYVNVDSGATFDVIPVRDERSTVDGYVVRCSHHRSNRGLPLNVQSGYSTVEEANAALDELMSTLDFVQVQPPVTDEEKAVGE